MADTGTPTRTEQALANLNVPRGVAGRQRALYLGLDDRAKWAYRYHYYVMGNPAAIAHSFAVEPAHVVTGRIEGDRMPCGCAAFAAAR
jgi:hypothetical protein